MRPVDRVTLAKQVVKGWEAMGKPGGSIRDNMLMIRDELEHLRLAAVEEPRLQPRIDALIARFQLIAMRLKLGLN